MILPGPRAGGPAPLHPPPVPARPAPELRAAVGQFRRLTLLMRPFWGPLLKGMGAGLLVGLLGMVAPWVTKLLVDEVYPTRDVTLMHVLVGGTLALGATSMLMSGIQNYYNLTVNTLLNNSAGLLFFNHLQHLPMRFFEENRVGELMSRFGDVRRALQSVARVFQTVFVQGIYLLLVPPFLFVLEWRLALVALVSIPLTTGVVAATSRAMRKQWKRSAEAYADLNAVQTETLTQMRTLKSLGLEGYTFRRTRARLTTAMDRELRAGGLGQVVGTTNGLLNVTNTALLTFLGWRAILGGSMTLGDYMAFTAYLGYLYGPINQFVGLLSELQQSAVSLDRMFEYLDTAPEQDPGAAYHATPPIVHRIEDGEVALEEVSFSYAPGKEALREVSLTLRPGQVTAVVGQSGSGKTSLLRLLTRLEQVGSGRILVDGTPIERIPLVDLRRQVAVVWQEHSLLNGTVWENLTLGLDEVDPEVVYHAARLAQVDGFIRELPGGYDTPVAEAGMSLSGGQRQRLAIARALVRRAPILLLDEATANVDLQTEARILEDVLAAYRDRTVVFVTHRV
ncbi:MAG: peptidase domain-containing ABC transporter, partial [Gemmatimonadetes bacterium]|nr:peptidase domain-containing ABC transporter [Gemmatimonadota bacterium]